MNNAITMRMAMPGDKGLVLRFIQELAEYEHLSHTVVITEEILYDWILTGKVEVLFAEDEGKPVGFALYYFTYSTFRGQTSLYIEDIFVRPKFRSKGIGTQFFHELARIAKTQNCFRMDWTVLNWNVNSIAFYENLGGHPVDDWTTYRLQGDALERLASN